MEENNIGKVTALCGVFGILAVASYVVGAIVELPIPDGMSLLIFFGFPLFGIIQWYLLRRVLAVDGKTMTGDLAMIFAALGFALLTAMVMAQMAVRLGISELQSQLTLESDLAGSKMLLKGVRFVDFGLDVAWDFFIGVAFILTGFAMKRFRGLGLIWGLPLSILGVLLIFLNAWTFPWPPNTRGLFDIGPFCAAYMFILGVRLVLIGRARQEK